VDSILLGLALITFVWFAGSLATRLRDAGEPRLAAVAFGGAVATAAVFAIGIAVQAAVAYRIASERPTLVKSFVELDDGRLDNHPLPGRHDDGRNGDRGPAHGRVFRSGTRHSTGSRP
jgi:hypothetical protein